MSARKPPEPPPPWWTGLERFLLPEEKRRFGIPDASDTPTPATAAPNMVAQLYQPIDALRAMVDLASNTEKIPDRNVRSGLRAAVAIVASAIDVADGVNKTKAKRALKAMATHIPHIFDKDLAWDSRRIEIEALEDDFFMFLEHVPAYAAARGITVRDVE